VTGYALGDDDGMWHQHSWLWDGKRVIEPNNAPMIYFGVILAPEQASHFFFTNVIFCLPGMAEILSRARGRRSPSRGFPPGLCTTGPGSLGRSPWASSYRWRSPLPGGADPILIGTSPFPIRSSPYMGLGSRP
jgi:hypothetical protein